MSVEGLSQKGMWLDGDGGSWAKNLWHSCKSLRNFLCSARILPLLLWESPSPCSDTAGQNLESPESQIKVWDYSTDSETLWLWGVRASSEGLLRGPSSKNKMNTQTSPPCYKGPGLSSNPGTHRPFPEIQVPLLSFPPQTPPLTGLTSLGSSHHHINPHY